MTSESTIPALRDVTVVVPCWGRYVESLSTCLRSVPVGAGVVVVGDEAARAVANASAAVFIAMDAAGGLALARETGLRAVRTRFVCFLDVDDELLSGGLEELTRALVAHPRAVASVGTLRRTTTLTSWPDRRWAWGVRAPGGAVLQLFRNSMPSVDACLVRRDRIGSRTLFPPMEDEDWHASVTIRVLGRVISVGRDVASYSVRPGSISRQKRDPSRLRDSHDSLVRTAVSAGANPVLWRLVDVPARIFRRRDSARLLRHWGSLTHH